MARVMLNSVLCNTSQEGEFLEVLAHRNMEDEVRKPEWPGLEGPDLDYPDAQKIEVRFYRGIAASSLPQELHHGLCDTMDEGDIYRQANSNGGTPSRPPEKAFCCTPRVHVAGNYPANLWAGNEKLGENNWKCSTPPCAVILNKRGLHFL